MKLHQVVTHAFAPIYNSESEILILGTMPSVKSRENQFYYGHPQNRFWRVMAAALSCAVPTTIKEKEEMLLSHKIALWDVLHSCEIVGSDDNTIRKEIPNDLVPLIEKTKIKRIVTNGKKAEKLYQKYCFSQIQIESVAMPSTSPANASWSLERLVKEWTNIFCVPKNSFEIKKKY